MIGDRDLLSVIPNLYFESARVIFNASMPILMLVSFVGVLINFLAIGPVFTFEVFKFDIKKFDPVQNLKGKFKMKTLVELLKSLLKVSIAGYLVYGVMYKSLPVLIKTVSMPMSSSLLIFYAFLMEVVMKVGLFFVVIAVIDFAYQKYTFAKEMKMEKFEIKQEYKNSEGDPQIKGKRKQIAQEIAYSDAPSASIKQAAAIITNPTHLAIAVGYKRSLDVAPYILTMGQGFYAEQIIKTAKENNIPIVRNIKLAHHLFTHGEVYEYVPEETYEAVAEILRWIQSLEEDPDANYEPNVEIG